MSESPTSRKLRLQALRDKRIAVQSSTHLTKRKIEENQTKITDSLDSSVSLSSDMSEEHTDEQGNVVVAIEDLAMEGKEKEGMLVFRNYRPKDEGIEKQSVLLERTKPANIDEAVKEILDVAKRDVKEPLANV